MRIEKLQYHHHHYLCDISPAYTIYSNTAKNERYRCPFQNANIAFFAISNHKMYLQNWRRELKTFPIEYEKKRFLQFLVIYFASWNCCWRCSMDICLCTASTFRIQYNSTIIQNGWFWYLWNNIFELFYVTCAIYTPINDVSLHCNFNILLSFSFKKVCSEWWCYLHFS